MKNLNKSALMLAAALAANAACAQSGAVDNWRGNAGDLVWKNGTQELCWRAANWTPATAAPGCDGALAPQVHGGPAALLEKPSALPQPQPRPPAIGDPFYGADAFFDFDQTALKPEGKARLDDLVRKIRNIDLEVIIATGHTDSIGTAAYNQRLSYRRAEAVKVYLMSRGIDGNRIYIEGKGKTQPLADNRTRQGRAQNRRVEIQVVGEIIK